MLSLSFRRARANPLLRTIQSHFFSRSQYFPSKQSKPGSDSPPKHRNHPSKSLDFDVNTVRETLISYRNDWKRAFDFFKWVESECYFNHTPDTFNSMIDILGKFFEFHLSWDLIELMSQNPSSPPDHTTFRIMFKRYVSAHLVQEAIDTYERLGEFNLKDETSYCNLIDALCEYKHVIEAQELVFEKFKNLSFNSNVKIYNMILRGWFKMGWWSKCREFWEEMDKKGICKDLHSYSIYMNIMCKSGKPWKAVKLYKQMKRKGMKLDVVAFNTVIQAIGLSEGVDFSIGLFREMRDSGVQPSAATYNIVVKLLCENWRYKEALKMLDEMPKKGCEPNAITYHSIFGCLEKPHQILRLFHRMIGRGVLPRLDTYVMLMRKFGRWGFIQQVLTVWKKMEELGCSPDESAYNALIDALLDHGMVDLAQKYDEEMLAKGLSAKRRVELETEVD